MFSDGCKGGANSLNPSTKRGNKSQKSGAIPETFTSHSGEVKEKAAADMGTNGKGKIWGKCEAIDLEQKAVEDQSNLEYDWRGY